MRERWSSSGISWPDQRTVLANQRTLFSLIRTVLSIWGAGVLLIKLGRSPFPGGNRLDIDAPGRSDGLSGGIIGYRRMVRVIAQETNGDGDGQAGGPSHSVLS